MFKESVFDRQTVVDGEPKAPFSISTTPRSWGGHNSFPRIAPLTLDPYLIMMSIKQGGTKYPFWVFGMTRRGIEPWSSRLLCRKPSTPLESELFCSWSWWMKALSRNLSIDIEQYAEIVLTLTRLLYVFITCLINPFYCSMLFCVCLYKPQINIITQAIGEHYTLC